MTRVANHTVDTPCPKEGKECSGVSPEVSRFDFPLFSFSLSNCFVFFYPLQPESMRVYCYLAC